MYKCRCKDKIIYIFDFYKENKIISNEYVQFLKKASNEGELICDCCKERLRFNYGKKIKPYFSHMYDSGKNNCKILKETSNQIRIKRVFYEKIIRDFLGAHGEINYRFENGIYTDLFFEFEDGKKLAIDYIDDIGKLNRNEKVIFFNNEGIRYVKVIDAKLELFREIYGEANNGYLYSFIDYDYKNILVLDDFNNKMIIFSEKNNKLFKEIFFEKYDLKEFSFKEILKLK